MRNLGLQFCHLLLTYIFFFIRLPSEFLCWHGDVQPPHLVQPCYIALGRALNWGLYPDIDSGTTATRHPAVWIVTSYSYLWAINIVIQSGDSNLGPKCLSLLELLTSINIVSNTQPNPDLKDCSKQYHLNGFYLQPLNLWKTIFVFNISVA